MIIPANDVPFANMKLQMTNRNGVLTIEFDRQVSWLQFNAVDAKRFVHGLIEQIKDMEAN